jgi:hypothetical protein
MRATETPGVARERNRPGAAGARIARDETAQVLQERASRATRMRQ